MVMEWFEQEWKEYLRIMKTCERCGKEIKKDVMDTKGVNSRSCEDCHWEILKVVNEFIKNGLINLRDGKLK